MSNWHKIFESSTPIRAEIVKGVLEEKGITAVIVNKKDPVYKIHGNIEVMVLEEQAQQALKIVENEISF
ncbi:putative signal transducing protein [Cyclobacterium amurskyense]|jgi:hypothetical protein|uniref:DUF2007 domain-containing protein n=1 Tax=Cyclobacterium amurskyense TaxID=320787 RepID=A0A0H4P8G5_9BACT|nr:DUF2007 domain-containing protein [Cyclobacterium amurskyense]AKP50766.1 hypothetical protein CA2015_1319 [Cyclobacterium amurskyense]|tara:strand:- start:9310 stop:9516 length:207 start_codon:yes stop_codon:yes gene_type:complete